MSTKADDRCLQCRKIDHEILHQLVKVLLAERDSHEHMITQLSRKVVTSRELLSDCGDAISAWLTEHPSDRGQGLLGRINAVLAE